MWITSYPSYQWLFSNLRQRNKNKPAKPVNFIRASKQHQVLPRLTFKKADDICLRAISVIQNALGPLWTVTHSCRGGQTLIWCICKQYLIYNLCSCPIHHFPFGFNHPKVDTKLYRPSIANVITTPLAFLYIFCSKGDTHYVGYTKTQPMFASSAFTISFKIHL